MLIGGFVYKGMPLISFIHKFLANHIAVKRNFMMIGGGAETAFGLGAAVSQPFLI